MTQTLKCCPTKQFSRCTYYFAPVLLGHLVYVQCPVFQASVILLIILVVLELFQDITGKAWHILYVAYNMWHPLDLFNNWAIWCLSSLPKCLDRSQASKLLSNILSNVDVYCIGPNTSYTMCVLLCPAWPSGLSPVSAQLPTFSCLMSRVQTGEGGCR